MLNPFGEFKAECEKLLRRALHGLLSHEPQQRFLLTPPASPGYGELSTPICFELGRTRGESPARLAERVAEEIEAERDAFRLLEKVEPVNGYLNFRVSFAPLAEATITAVRSLKREYGLLKTPNPEKIIVEHTSANPSGPLHIGTARNAILGDALARILRARGHQVQRRFYVNDVGRQVATTAYGFKLLGGVRVEGKPDLKIGFVYSATNCALAIRRLKERVRRLEEALAAASGETRRLHEELARARAQLDENVTLASELEAVDRETFETIYAGVSGDPDPEAAVEAIIRAYETGQPEAVRLVKKIVRRCLKGFRQTLRWVKIEFDAWDWESELVWSGEVKRAVESLRRTPYVASRGGALELDVNWVAEDLGLKEKLLPGSHHHIPPLVLTRRDGSSLYTTRDIAYQLRKLSWADKAINVIGADQKLAQLQLKVALKLLGVEGVEERLVHYSYELVKLPGYKMSRRMGRYVTLDEILEQAIEMAYGEVSKRALDLPQAAKRRIARAVGLGAVKYALLGVSAPKPVTFSWERVLNFEMNSAPYLQYTHARASSILRKAAGLRGIGPDYGALQHQLERSLTLKVSSFPSVVADAADELKPELLIEFLNGLADDFNAFYSELPVLQAEPPGLRDARLGLVLGVRVVISNALRLLGIEPLSRM